MSAATARNWASMLKEKKTVVAAPKTAVAVPTEAPAKSTEPAPSATTAAPAAVPAVVPAKEKEVAVAQPVEDCAPSPVSISEPVEVAAPAVTYTSLGPVLVPEALAKLVQPSEFRFAGSVAPRAPVTAATQPVVSQPAPVTPPAPAAAAPAVTSSSEVPRQPQRAAPQSVYSPPVNYFVPRPYGGELGSVPRYFNVEQQHHAQPYHPTYQTPYSNFRGGYGGAAYNPYDNMYPNYYPGQGVPYMGGRLQAQPPYYPQRANQLQQ